MVGRWRGYLVKVGHLHRHGYGGVGVAGGCHHGERVGVVTRGGGVCLVVGGREEMEYTRGRVEVELARVRPAFGIIQGSNACVVCHHLEEGRGIVLGDVEAGRWSREGGNRNERRPVVRPIGICGKGRFNQTFVGIG